MVVFVITFVVMLFLVGAMAVGVLMGREPIKGSCGGMTALGMDTACDICAGDEQVCEEQNKLVALAKTKLAYDASSDR